MGMTKKTANAPGQADMKQDQVGLSEATASGQDTPAQGKADAEENGPRGGGPGKGGGLGPIKAQKLREQVRAAEAMTRHLQRQLDEQPAYPVARPATLKRRHWGILVSFVICVLLPLVLVVYYLWAIAEDQYVSTSGFVVRSQDATAASEALGGLAQLVGDGTASDSDVLYAFIQSQEIVEVVEREVGLRAHFSAHWPGDWAFALWPDATLEDLTDYWQRILGISYESGSGLMEVEASAYDPETAQAITRAIIAASQDRINALNEQARDDAMRYARADLDDAVAQLKAAREALTQFRTRTRILDPQADIQGRMGVMHNLQQQLAEALVEYDLLRGSLNSDDPRLKTAEKTIDVIRERIDIERQTFASDNTETGGLGENYPSLISEYERLTVDQQYAEQVYRASLATLEVARDEATRQSRYLATYIKPTLPESSQYPDRPVMAGIAGLLLLLVWSIFVLVYYSIRDRS
nr:sugar transporter [Ruegeria sp. PR1b]